MLKFISLVVVFSFLFGCANTGPKKWANEFVDLAKCGMTLKDVEGLSSKKLVKRDPPSVTGVTHLLGGELDTTQISLSFNNNRLQWIQVHIITDLMHECSYPVVDLCGKMASGKREQPRRAQ